MARGALALSWDQFIIADRTPQDEIPLSCVDTLNCLLRGLLAAGEAVEGSEVW